MDVKLFIAGPEMFKEETPADCQRHQWERRASWRKYPGPMTTLGHKILGETAERYRLNRPALDVTTESKTYKT